MTATATHAPQLFTCACDVKPEPHLVSVPRVLVAADPQVDPERVRDALTGVWYDLTLFYGPGVPMVITYEGEATGAAKVARDWATEHGFAAESYDGEFIAANVAPEGAAYVAGEGRPTYRYAA
ncbi:hypothetical protein ACIQ9Q_29205 [Streptomyces sp. NPDC094438]|uniref:hypothetical protein n=1 Tax=Streptomyces sp. NPDC094438 TaxID=3366061 RepID=UPI0038127CA0